MNHYKKNSPPAIFFISLLLVGSLIAPSRAQAVSGANVVSGCATSVAINAGVSYLAGLLTSVVGAVLSVPISNMTIESSTGASSRWETYIKPVEDCLVYGAGQMMLDNLTQNIIGATKTGNGGNPSFAVDLNALLLSVVDKTTGGLANQILGINTCNFSPNFNVKLANQVTLSTRSGATAKFQNQIRCPFPAGASAQNFYNDFNQGGWRAFEKSLSDNGNPFGTGLLASQENQTRQSEVLSVKRDELQQANGFISKEECDGVDSYTGLPIFCHVTTPGKLIQDQLSHAVGTDMQRLGFADTLSKLISAYVSKWTADTTSGIFK